MAAPRAVIILGITIQVSVSETANLLHFLHTTIISLFLHCDNFCIVKEIISPLFRENLQVSIGAVRANRLRSVLTITIIAIGITSLVGIMSAMEAVKGSVNSNFGKLGAGSFTVSASYSTTTSEEHKRIKNKRELSYAQIRRFMEAYDIPGIKTAYVKISSTDIFKTADTKSDPRMTLIAADENYLDYLNLQIKKGQMLTKSDNDNSSFRCVIGAKTANLLFGDDDPVGKKIMIRGACYVIAGVTARQGDSMDSFDSATLIPLSTARASLLNEEAAYKISIKPAEHVSMSEAMSRAEVLFRAIRRLEPADETDFSVEGNDSMLEMVNKILGNVSIVALAIGLITLLGAAVGLMNIMLVSVKERTREIGTRKALGATSATIRQQFFMEAVIIGQIGGIIGIILGVGATNILLLVLKAGGIFPWFWMFTAVILCFLVSILSCSIPAKKAADLDPIEALRYE